jgi:hypothetical protein
MVLGLVLVGCPDDDDDATVDDDDAWDDDDVSNDDDAGDDDDTAPPDPIECDGSLPVVLEVEVNDVVETATDVGDVPNEGFCLQGSMECGSQAYQDIDLYSFSLPADREVRVVLRWTAAADMDVYLWDRDAYDPKSKNWLIPFEDGLIPPEDGEADVLDGQPLLVEVACWIGQDGDYTVEVTYVDVTLGGDDDDDSGADDDDDDIAGDDDDSSGDDDDSAGDDDDDSTGDDDDDSAGDDDDDSAGGDDDDSAGDDDDLGDDDSAGDDDDSAGP